MVERRTETGKVFIDPDDPKTLYLQSFAGPVHIRDRQGRWRPTDPRLEFVNGRWISTAAFCPVVFDPLASTVRLARPDGDTLVLNARNRIVLVHTDGTETVSEPLRFSHAQVSGTRIFAPHVGPNVHMIQTAGLSGLKTDYELLSPPDESVALWCVEEEIELPPGGRMDFDPSAQITPLGRLGEPAIYDASGREIARWERPRIYDALPERDAAQRHALFDAAAHAGIVHTPYAYRLSVEGSTARLRLVVDARLLRLPQTVYPVVIDPQVSVPVASTSVFGVGQNLTCTLPLQYTVPGGYSVVNVINNMLRYQATGLCCGLNLLGICLGTSCAFSGVRARIVGPCGQAEGYCNNPGQGTCTLTGDVPFVADCVVGQCTDYPITLVGELVSLTACGGTTCAATDCYRIDPGDLAFTIVARSVETTATTDVAPIVGTPPSVQVCAETPFHLIGTPAYGVPPYTFEWFMPDGTILSDSMPLVTLYQNALVTLIAHDACGSSEPYTFTVTTIAPPTFSETITMPTCGANNGSIALTNLPPNAVIVWENGAGGATRTNLAPGQYVVVVSDGVCPKTKVYNLEAVAEAVELTVQTLPPTCLNPLAGEITLFAQGNFGPYDYAVVAEGQFPQYQSTPVFTGLGEGVYTLQVRDVNQCVYTHPVPVVFSVPDPIQVAGVETTPAACLGAPTGTIALTGVTGGTGGYEFSLAGGQWQSAGTFTGLGAGTYVVRVRDGGGCFYSTTATVLLAPPLNVAAVEAQAVTCDTDGRLTLSVEGGAPPYTYSFDNGQTFGDEATWESSTPGSVWVRVRDAYGCVAGVHAVLPGVRRVSMTALAIPSSCPAAADGILHLYSGADEYSIDGGQTFLSAAMFPNAPGRFEGLTAGTYEAVVRNGDGCEHRMSIVLPAHVPQMRFESSPAGTVCAGDWVSVHVLGPHNAVWTAPPGGPVFEYMDAGRLVGFRPQTTTVFTVTGDFGSSCTATDTLSVQVQPRGEVRAGFYPRHTVFEHPPFAVEFVNTSEEGLEYVWDFGDESVSTEFSPTRVFADTGRYEVKLTVRRPGACDQAVVRRTIHVTTARPTHRTLQPEGFVLFPNPGENVLYIRSHEPLHAVVFNVAGQKLAETDVFGATEHDIGAWPRGSYVWMFTRRDGTVFSVKVYKK
jgi:hypothetical protein